MTVRTSLEKAAKSVLGAISLPTEGGPDILDTLQSEHEEVQELLGKLVRSDNGREQKSLLAKIKSALVPHTKAEERVVYDAVLALKGVPAKVDGKEGYIEHGLASETLKRRSTSNLVAPGRTDLIGSFCTKRIDRNWLGEELGDAEEEAYA